MKKLIRKWLGIEKDLKDIKQNSLLFGKAINRIFKLKEKNKDIFKTMDYIFITEMMHLK